MSCPTVGSAVLREERQWSQNGDITEQSALLLHLRHDPPRPWGKVLDIRITVECVEKGGGWLFCQDEVGGDVVKTICDAWQTVNDSETCI